MSGHTPGPWSVSGTMTKYVEARIPGGLVQEVAACGPTQADGGYGPTQIANARLIAAAPELLAALEDLYEAYGRSVAADDWDLEAGRSAAAAIAKAVG